MLLNNRQVKEIERHTDKLCRVIYFVAILTSIAVTVKEFHRTMFKYLKDIAPNYL